MTVDALSKKLSLTILSPGEADDQAEVSGCYIGDLLSWVMGRAKKGDCWVTIMTNLNVAAVASLTEVSMVILAEGCQPDEGLLQKASAVGLGLFGSPKSAYELACDLCAAFEEEA